MCRWTALHYAVAFGHVEVCKVLLRHNIDIHRANALGHYAQEYADTNTENGKIIHKLIDGSFVLFCLFVCLFLWSISFPFLR
jgi:ankyrin repeat protein